MSDLGGPVAIVGAGFSGLGLAIELKRAGFEDFFILESAEELGGTWRDNTYPGCACDVPSHLYSFSFAPNPGWSRSYGTQPEILAYMKEVAERWGLERHIRYGQHVESARWDEDTGWWTLGCRGGQEHRGRVVSLGTGALSRPFVPRLEGLETFRGPVFHSARWDHEVELEGKRVAVVGTGASAVQFVPQLAPRVASLHLLQRTPPWIVPKPDRPFAALERQLFERLPPWRWLYRTALYWQAEGRGIAFLTDRRLMRAFEFFARRYIRECFPDDEEMRRRVTPDYTMGCKRILFSNDYYPALARDNVELMGAAARVEPGAIVDAEGARREVDAIVFGTGFHVSDYLEPLHIVGRDGLTLEEAWTGGAHAYLGIAVSGFPNLFLMVGPNTGLGHNSIIFMIEAQARYIRQCVELLADERARALEVRPAVAQRFDEEVQRRHRGNVWQSGCRSWYVEEDGRNSTLWPSYTFDYWRQTRALDPADFRLRWDAPAAATRRRDRPAQEVA